jgi:hypothetical protein
MKEEIDDNRTCFENVRESVRKVYGTQYLIFTLILRDESFSSSVMMSLVRRIFTIGKKYFSN